MPLLWGPLSDRHSRKVNSCIISSVFKDKNNALRSKAHWTRTDIICHYPSLPSIHAPSESAIMIRSFRLWLFASFSCAVIVWFCS